MKPRTSTLFHFTKSIEDLKGILTTGFWPKYCLEDISWYNHQIGHIAFPMVCFCDIPLSRLDIHVERYGSYGIGMAQEWGIKNGLNPVHYITDSSYVFSSISRVIGCHKTLSQYYPGSETDTIILMSMIKTMNFYQECEWRYVPPHANCIPWISKEQYQSTGNLHQMNENTKRHYSVPIIPEDIRYLFVKEVEEIPELVNFLQSSHGNYSVRDNQILMSRIISLEDIRSDI